ncbi:MAG: hypothetical protein H6825_10120 [Planctomycetes bacterium]|nr:hypothetical protein [Planctomycetota bacterium]
MSIAADDATVASGRAFELTVVRRWSDDLLPRDVDDDAWRPLFVRLVGSARETSGGVTEETLRYRAWVFGEGPLEFAPPAFEAVPRAGGARQVASAESVALNVTSALAEEDAPEPELPGPPLDGPLTPTAFAARVLGALLLATLGLLAARSRRRPAHGREAEADDRAPRTPDAGASSARDAVGVALRALDTLRAGADDDAPAAVEALALGLSGMLRVFVAARFGVPTAERTSPEIVDALRAVLAPARDASAAAPTARDAPALLASLLHRCDAVKFGRALPDAAARARLLDDASGFVHACAPREDAP